MSSPPVSNLTPEVGRLHYNDLSREWRVCASFQLQTPLGNLPHQEVCVDAADMLAAVGKLLEVWAGASFVDENVKVNAPIGSNAALLDYVTNVLPTVPVLLLDAPTPPDNNTAPDDDVVIYTGDYGIVTGP